MRTAQCAVSVDVRRSLRFLSHKTKKDSAAKKYILNSKNKYSFSSYE